MPRRSKVLSLPDDVRQALNQKLLEQGFQGYEDLEDWLEAQGFEISKSALHRYGQDFEARVERLRVATEQARAIVEGAPDDEGNLNDAIIRLLQEKLLKVLQEIDIDPENVSFKELGLLIARSSRASVTAKKWAAETRERLRVATEEAKDKMRKGGVSEKTIAEVESALNIL